ncbi:site-specific integrase [Xinfangfangia sp. D13-10-4-6]|uniref:tyrosine-type recombinase/integrase n=1 Tax=Pseudogemmobacter hezensis TaxID=2737662 RepID=UPI001553DCB3|nr:site-specific integrase [Pseudogemmobacter hezensis]NPD16117.1 site-specific integrase [Pseudogemmobacter hezensis]
MGQGNRSGIVTLTGLKVVTRRGKTYRYFQRKGQPLIKLPDLPVDHPDFLRTYADAKKAAPEKAPVTAGSFEALVRAALSSDHFKQSKDATRAMFRRHCDALVTEFGALSARGLRSRHIRANLPQSTSQGHRLRTWRFLCNFGVTANLLERNEALDVAMPKAKAKGGHPPWTSEEVEAFRKRWPMGSSTRAAFEILRFSGARISDAVCLGPGMVRDGVLSYRQVKTGGPAHIPWTCPLPDFAQHLSEDRALMHEALKALTGQMTFLDAKGKARSEKALGTMIREAAIDAGFKKSAHGLRKSLATELAEGGATAHQISSWTGHETLKEVDHYTKSADRRRAVIGTEQDRNIVNRSGQRWKT